MVAVPKLLIGQELNVPSSRLQSSDYKPERAINVSKRCELVLRFVSSKKKVCKPETAHLQNSVCRKNVKCTYLQNEVYRYKLKSKSFMSTLAQSFFTVLLKSPHNPDYTLLLLPARNININIICLAQNRA